MAIALLVHQGANRLRYLITAEGTGTETVNITTVGTATPDTLTDSLTGGTIKKLSKVVADGYGTFAAGAQTTAKAKALWLSDLSGADPSSGSPAGSKLTTAKLALTRRTGAGDWGAEAFVSVSDPLLRVTVIGGGTAYLDVEAPNTIGV